MLWRFPRCHLPDCAPVSRLPTDGDQQLPWQQRPPPARLRHEMLPAKQRSPRRRSSPSPEEDESWLPRGNFPVLIISPQAALPKPLPHSAGTGLDLESQPDSSCFFFIVFCLNSYLAAWGCFVRGRRAGRDATRRQISPLRLRASTARL